MTKQFPDGAPCRIVVILRDGRTISQYRDFSVGDPHDPLSDHDIAEKAHGYLTIFTDEREADAIIERIWNLEEEDSIDWLVAPFKKRVLHKMINRSNRNDKAGNCIGRGH